MTKLTVKLLNEKKEYRTGDVIEGVVGGLVDGSSFILFFNTN